jgi:hypothetical protein
MLSTGDRRETTGPGVTIGSTDAATGNLQSVRFGSPATETKVRSLLNKSETIRVRLIPGGGEDVEGHLSPTGDTTAVLVRLALDDDDVEGHAMSIHFPDIDGARRFRNELLAAGVLTATVAMSAGAGIALAPSGQAAGGASATHAAVTDTFAGAREGTIAISIGGSSTDTSANIREGGAALAPEDEDSTQQTPETYRGHSVPPWYRLAHSGVGPGVGRSGRDSGRVAPLGRGQHAADAAAATHHQRPERVASDQNGRSVVA